MKPIPALLALAGALAAVPCASAAMPHLEAETSYAPNVPPPLTRRQPAIVEMDLTATRKVLPLTSRQSYEFWTFNGHVPGPMIRARVGDWLEVHVANTDTGGMPHNVDFHAVTGPGGGAPLLTVAPGQTQTAWFRLNVAGLFCYHCAMSPMLDHIANGMFGMILVEPTNGLPHADREFYIMQSELYATNAAPDATVLQYSRQDALDERPRLVLFNGQPGAMLFNDALQAKTGERVRIYFGNAGPNLISSFHVIGTVMDVYREGSLANPPERELQTVAVPPGDAAIVDFTPVVPGTYTFVDHSMAHMEMGAMGQVVASGPPRPEIYRSAQDGPPTD